MAFRAPPGLWEGKHTLAPSATQPRQFVAPPGPCGRRL